MAQRKIQLPRPTGSYSVGISTHFLKDISRHHNEEELTFRTRSRPTLKKRHLLGKIGNFYAIYPPTNANKYKTENKIQLTTFLEQWPQILANRKQFASL